MDKDNSVDIKEYKFISCPGEFLKEFKYYEINNFGANIKEFEEITKLKFRVGPSFLDETALNIEEFGKFKVIKKLIPYDLRADHYLVKNLVSGSVSGSVSSSVSGSVSGSVSDSVSGSVSGSVSDSVSGSVSDSVGGSVSDSVSGSVSDSVGDSVERPYLLSCLLVSRSTMPKCQYLFELYQIDKIDEMLNHISDYDTTKNKKIKYGCKIDIFIENE